MNQPHIVKAFDKDLLELSGSIRAMGEFAATQFTNALNALLHRDLAQAQRVIDQDRDLDALRRDVSAAAAGVITKRQPMAGDLDEVLADFRISEELERVGDLAKNTAKRAMAIASRTFAEDVTANLSRLGEAASEQLRMALAAYAARDPDLALAAREQDEELDRLHTAVFREIVAQTSGDQPQVVGFVHLLFCAKNIERVGDHAVHIAEAAYKLATGHAPATERRRFDESSTITGDTLVNVLRPNFGRSND
ncbi:MAG: phosphate signaling complex protein PhoU [Steroidobacteraceae bacterium]